MRQLYQGKDIGTRLPSAYDGAWGQVKPASLIRAARARERENMLAAEVAAWVQSQLPTLELFKRLDEMHARLAGVDATFRPIRDRVLRSRVQIGHIWDEALASDGQHFNAVRLELVNALWWEIRMIGFLRERFSGKPPGAIGDTQKLLRKLLEENPDAHTTDAVVHLNLKLPDHGLKRASIAVALSKARKARAKER